MMTTKNAPNTPSSSFCLAILPTLFRRPVFQDDDIAYPVSHDCELVVVLQRQINNFFDLLPRTHDANWNHALANSLTLMHPRAFTGRENSQPAADRLNLLIPNLVETGS